MASRRSFRRYPRRVIYTHGVNAAASGGTTPPTVVTGVDLVEGTGTRSFTAVTTQAGDYLVVGIQVESGNTGWTVAVSGGSLTYTTQIDSGAVGNTNGRAMLVTAPDAAGGSRTVTITTGGTVLNYRARLTVVRGSTGPGTGKAASSTAQTVSVTRQGNNSMMFMGVTDWSTGAVGSPTWTPGGSTTASQQGTAGTYIFGRWDDSGTAGTASHGISTPSFTTPAVAVLEMLGTAGGGGGGVTGDLTGGSTATATVDATAVAPAAIVEPIVVTDATTRPLVIARQLPIVVVLRTTTPPPAASGDVSGAATTAASVAASRTDTGAATGSATASATVSAARSDAAGTTGAATAAATVDATAAAPPAVAKPIVVSGQGLGYRARLAYDPTAVVIPPVQVTAGGAVTGTATASASVTATRTDVGATTGAVTASATVAAQAGTAGDLSGTVTAAATVTASATSPVSPARPLVVSDPQRFYLARLVYEPSTVLIPPLAAASTVDVNGTAVASATVTATALNPAAVAEPIVVVDQGRAWWARQPADLSILVFAQVDSTTGQSSGDVTGATTAAATVTASAVQPVQAEPLVVVDQGRAALLRQQPLDRFTLVNPVRVPATSGDLNGSITAAASVTAVRSDVGAVSGATTAAATVTAGTFAAGAATGAATASATVTAVRVGTATTTGTVTASATVRAVASGLVLGPVTASAVVTAAESGGTFIPIGVLTPSTAPTSVLVGASQAVGVLTSSTSRAGGPQ